MRKKKKGVIKIVSGKRSWYERLLASIFYGVAFYLIFLFYKNVTYSFTEVYYIKNIKVLSGLIVLFTFGIKFSYTVNHHFDFDLKKYREYWSVGPFGLGKWKSLKELKRVSTFFNNKGYCEVNIWDIKNNRFKIAAFDKIEDAVIYGRDLAKNLDIKFLERN